MPRSSLLMASPRSDKPQSTRRQLNTLPCRRSYTTRASSLLCLRSTLALPRLCPGCLNIIRRRGRTKRSLATALGSPFCKMGKAKPAKHTAAEIKAKVHAATTNMGGGKAGLQDRLGGKAGHAKWKCPICMTAAPDLKSMQLHHEAKHPSLPFDADKCQDAHAAVGGTTTQGVAVRGSKKK